MLDKARLGNRFVCYVCGTKFYDMNRPVPTCPDCNANQKDAPVRDIKSLLSKGGGRRRNEPDFDELEEEDLDEDAVGGDDDGDDDDDDLGLLGDDEEEEGGGEDLD